MEKKTKLQIAVKVYQMETGTTTKHLADAVGITCEAFNNKLSGRNQLKFHEAKALSEILGMTLDELYEIAPKVNRTNRG